MSIYIMWLAQVNSYFKLDTYNLHAYHYVLSTKKKEKRKAKTEESD